MIKAIAITKDSIILLAAFVERAMFTVSTFILL